MACRACIGGTWFSGWIRGKAGCCVVVFVCGVAYTLCPECVHICRAGEYHEVRLDEIPEHLHGDSDPAQHYENADIGSAGTTTSDDPNQPFFDTFNALPPDRPGTPDWLLPTVFNCP